MPTVREVLTARIQRLVGKRQHAVELAQTLQSEIDAARAELAALSGVDEGKLARLQAIGVIKIED